MLQQDAGKKLHDNEIEIRRQSLELMKEKKRSTDLESELQSVQVIANSRSTYINQLKHELEEKSKEYRENIHRYQILNDQKNHEVTMLKKELEILKMKQQQSEGKLLEVNLDLWGKDEQLKEMRSRENLLQHEVEKLKQGRQLNDSVNIYIQYLLFLNARL